MYIFFTITREVWGRIIITIHRWIANEIPFPTMYSFICFTRKWYSQYIDLYWKMSNFVEKRKKWPSPFLLLLHLIQIKSIYNILRYRANKILFLKIYSFIWFHGKKNSKIIDFRRKSQNFLVKIQRVVLRFWPFLDYFFIWRIYNIHCWKAY